VVTPSLASSQAASIVPKRVFAASPINGSAECPEDALRCGLDQNAGSIRGNNTGVLRDAAEVLASSSSGEGE